MSDALQNLSASGQPGKPAPSGSPKAKYMTRAAIQHAAPFFVWLGVMFIGSLMHLTPNTASEDIETVAFLTDAQLYTLKTVLASLAILLLRPWRYHIALQRANLLPALLIGLGVFAVWVIPESDWFQRLCPSVADLYERWCVRPFGELRPETDAITSQASYAPETTGWLAFSIHMLGTGIVIAIAEEFFWRAYLLRAARTPDFLDLDAGHFHPLSFCIVTAFFAAEHAEVLAGLIAGLAYGFLFIKTRDVWATCIAHAVTNLLLGFYVLQTGHWEFW